VGPSPLDSARGGYGDRFEEDTFDYPSPSASHAWSSDDTSTGPTESTADESKAAAGRRRRSPVRDETGWHAAVRRRSALTAVAAAVVLTGFGLALSTVRDTVTSNANPGGTAQISAINTPGPPSLPPDATLPAEPSGAGANPAVAPARTVLSPDRGDDDRGEEEQGREDKDHADD
ncbi:hypothetical protein ACN6LA_006331, partial [Streptomyces sp. SAS_269]|uniref:hypothetical protein n=1 Tax=Streptomyces sp. SAS_269 TaxID=3412749 RepID=UPI00403CAD9E